MAVGLPFDIEVKLGYLRLFAGTTARSSVERHNMCIRLGLEEVFDSSSGPHEVDSLSLWHEANLHLDRCIIQQVFSADPEKEVFTDRFLAAGNVLLLDGGALEVLVVLLARLDAVVGEAGGLALNNLAADLGDCDLERVVEDGLADFLLGGRLDDDVWLRITLVVVNDIVGLELLKH